MKWLGIDDVSALNARKYEMITLGERKTENGQVDYGYCGITVQELTVNPKPCFWTVKTAWVGFVTVIVQSHSIPAFQLSFALSAQ